MHSFQLLTTPCLELPVEKEKRAAKADVGLLQEQLRPSSKSMHQQNLKFKKKPMVITQNTSSRDLHPKANHPSVLKKQPEVH